MDDVAKLGSRSLSAARPSELAATRCPRSRFVSVDQGFELSSLQSQARQILSSAKYEAQLLLNSAKAKAREEVELARQEGFNAGVRLLTRELLAAHELRQSALASSERKILELALSLARTVIGEELSLNPQSILSRVERALSKIRAEGSLVLSIHPEM